MKKEILVVDDEPHNLRLLKDILEHEGHAVLSAHNGKQAIQLALKCKPDLILMDVGLPGVDGLTATKVLKNTPDTAAIPVLVVTGSGSSDDERRATMAGCDAFIEKPFELVQFRKTLNKYLSK